MTQHSGGEDLELVNECVVFAKRTFAKYGLLANSKSSSAEHVGAERKFLGTSTARGVPDLTRKKYREYRSELTAALTSVRSSDATIGETAMRSFHSKIGYVKRLNKRKARLLSNIFFRLCSARAEKER